MKTATKLQFAAALLLVESTFAADIDVVVTDRNGDPVPDVVVYATGIGAPANTDEVAIMDQVDKAFSPHILSVQKGTPVRFPNSDPVAHHVYSFSKPNAFSLPLYKGEEPDPVVFEHEGVVVLGCNIHDHMLGYILVIDSPVFEKTGEDGIATLSVPASVDELELRIWSPRIRDKEDVTVRRLQGDDGSPVSFELLKRLRPVHRQESWSDY
ncbi:MAG: methylamine utilization protein [Pseudomonadota bacterium]